MTAKQVEVKVLRTEIESEIVEEVAEDVAIPLVSGEPVEEGKTLVVLERGILFQKKGIVTKRNKGGEAECTYVSRGAQIKIEATWWAIPWTACRTRGCRAGRKLLRDPSKKLTSKEREMIRMQEDLVDLDSPLRRRGRRAAAVGSLRGRLVTRWMCVIWPSVGARIVSTMLSLATLTRRASTSTMARVVRIRTRSVRGSEATPW